MQTRRTFIKNCVILVAAAIATPAMGTSISAGAMEVAPALSRTVLREKALMNWAVERELYEIYGPEYSRRWAAKHE